ncbi:MAG: type II toxin-antitoxin system RelE/ParE family toxin [Actinomycetota bacterium]
MNIWQTARFDHTFKKLHSSSQAVVLQAIRRLVEDPSLGEQKSGDLGGGIAIASLASVSVRDRSGRSR